MAKDKEDKDDNPTGNASKDKNDDPQVKDETDKSKITVAINRDPEIDALQKELAKLRQEHDELKESSDEKEQSWLKKEDELKDKIDVMTAEKEKKALELFEEEKEEIIKLCTDSKLPEEQIEEIKGKLDTPQKLETVKSLVEMLVASVKTSTTDDGGQTNPKGDGKPKKPPAGKATIEAPSSTVDSDEENATKIVDEIYHILNNPQEYTPQQVKEAQKKRLTLVNSMIKGKAWDQLRKGTSLGTYKATMACPNCGSTIVGDKVPDRCPNCGFDLRKTGDMLPTRRR